MAKIKKHVTEEVPDKVHEELEMVKGMLARALADYDNLSRRTERDRSEFARMASAGLVMRLLSVLDNLERAEEHLKDAGLAISIGEFKSVLSEEGFEEIKIKVNETDFSSVDMEAIEAVDTNDEKLDKKVSEVISTGWRVKGSEPEIVIRPAKVKVYNLQSN